MAVGAGRLWVSVLGTALALVILGALRQYEAVVAESDQTEDH